MPPGPPRPPPSLSASFFLSSLASFFVRSAGCPLSERNFFIGVKSATTMVCGSWKRTPKGWGPGVIGIGSLVRFGSLSRDISLLSHSEEMVKYSWPAGESSAFLRCRAFFTASGLTGWLVRTTKKFHFCAKFVAATIRSKSSRGNPNVVWNWLR